MANSGTKPLCRTESNSAVAETSADFFSSICAAQPWPRDVSEYLTDGSGTGTIKVEIVDRDKRGKRRVETRTLEVQRDGLEWEVKRLVP